MALAMKPENEQGGVHPALCNEMCMLITPARVAYIGLLGRPQVREFGALTMYIALDDAFQIQVAGGEWASARMFVVAPDTPHRITSTDRLIGLFLIEPETVNLDLLPLWLQPSNSALQCLPALEQVCSAFQSLRNKQVNVAGVKDNVDEFFLGQSLAIRRLDARMEAIVDKINLDSCGLTSAEGCAKQVNLSFSRFLHLFRDDVGTTFRSFRAWKRARNFLCHVDKPCSLTDIALDIGYPDSSHFSHTVRRYWGLTPKDILAGSRRLAVIRHNTLGEH